MILVLEKVDSKIELDEELNDATYSKEAVISKPTSKVKVVVIPTDEELTIAEDTSMILEQVKSEIKMD